MPLKKLILRQQNHKFQLQAQHGAFAGCERESGVCSLKEIPRICFYLIALTTGRAVVLQNEAVNGDPGQRPVDESVFHPAAGPSSNGVDPTSSATVTAADTPGSVDRLSSDGTAEMSSSPLHQPFPSPSSSSSLSRGGVDVDLLRAQLRSESRRVRHLEELLQHRFSDVGNIREVRRYTTSNLKSEKMP